MAKTQPTMEENEKLQNSLAGALQVDSVCENTLEVVIEHSPIPLTCTDAMQLMQRRGAYTCHMHVDCGVAKLWQPETHWDS
eukprot:5170414-Pleurochrysis_carterae.AAC.1